MKKRKFFAALLSAVMFFAMVGCDPTPDPDPEPEPSPEEQFRFEILAKDKTSVSFRVTPLAEESPYLVMIIDKATFDSFEDVNDYIDDDIAWLRENATYEGMELEEFLAEVLVTGVHEGSTEGLSPATDYYLYAYHMNTYGDVVSDLEKVAFTTDDYEKVDLTLAVEVGEIGYNKATVTVTPSNPTATYFVNVFTEERKEYFAEGGGDAYKNHLVALRDYYLGMGATTDQMIANLGFVGTKALTVDELEVGQKHYAYAIGIDDNFLPNTEAFVVEFTTLAGESADLTFDVEITEVYYDHADGIVTPSNNDDTYICSIQSAESLTWYESDQEFMETLIMDLEWWYGGVESALRTGPTDLATLAGLSPETEYVVVCFGYDQTPTTELFTFPFTTSAANGNPADLEVELNIDYASLTHNSVNVEAIPSVGAHYFMSLIPKWEYDYMVEDYGSGDAAIIAFANGEIDYGAEWFGCSRSEYLSDMGAVLGRYTMMFNNLNPATEYLAYAIAVDVPSGEIASSRGFVSEVFTTLDKVVSDAAVEFVFGDYYDGTELADLDPTNFLSCKGYAVMPYEVVPTDSAMNWYTGFFNGDYTEWGCTDDDIYAELITYGYEWDSESVSLNRNSGVAVLSYDSDFTFLGIAEDFDGNFGVGTLEVVTLKREGVAPAEEFLALLGQQSAPLQCAAKAVAPRKAPVQCKKSAAQEMTRAPKAVKESREKASAPTLFRTCRKIAVR